MPAEPRRGSGAVGLTEIVEHVGVVVAVEVRQHQLRGPEVRQPASGREREHAVAQAQALHAVGHHDDGAAAIRQIAEQLHQASLVVGIKPRCRLVEEQQRRSREQLEPDAHALSLATRQSRHGGVAAMRERELASDLLQAPVALGRADVAGKPDVRGEVELALHGQLGMDDVVLGDVPDPLPERVVICVQAPVSVPDIALVGHPKSGQRAEQRRLAAARRPDHAEHRPRPEREAHAVQQDGAARPAERSDRPPRRRPRPCRRTRRAGPRRGGRSCARPRRRRARRARPARSGDR